ncbi:hypothetical protein CFN78_17825 [Amycolatopsis antarctica]|uniref:DUF4394 domain-containing protein n=1 Tax=Amycolatopsis antarctica TaxID=1854586 RepID=A0A263D0L6_9PSEU|nr:DUF4394 domain-containing protein [Amycolatopsis antarctica]OZM71994.1 hypothetical protein CFN78_17825 [Amycolatopsis antarctica]
MRKTTVAVAVAAVLASTAFGAGTATADNRPAKSDRGDLLVLGTDGKLTTYDSRLALLPKNSVRVTGVAKGDRLIGIDVRPANGALYAMSAKGQLHTVDARTGKATTVGAPVELAGSAIGFDFNPTVDRIRVVTDTGQNLRLVPDTGALAAADGTLAYAPGDPAEGRTPKVAASGYTNSVAGATSTLLYNLDAGRDTLVTQGTAPGVEPVVSPNTGQLYTVGKLGLNITAVNGFDISGAAPAGDYDAGDYRGVAAVRLDGLLGLSALVRVDLDTGRAGIVAPLLSAPVGITFTK